MLPDGTIRADQIWKRFRADRRFSKLKYEIQYLRDRARGGGDDAWRWALQQVDLHVEPGESLGLIGTNGSGKSTLLKILTRVMYPYAGSLDVAGRVGALIEVIAGIHPDLTGRENVYIYGSLLGLPRAAVAARFDEIVEFAEVGPAIDRQVKFYSSGMKMRLGFSVAAFLEPDILLVDEVLAVGDASFQQKCLERMRIVLNQGTTLVLVSHDLAAIEATCARGVWLQDGVVEMDGAVRPVLGAYRRSVEELAASVQRDDAGVLLTKVEATGPDGGLPQTQERFDVVVALETDAPVAGSLFVGVSEGTATPIFVVRRSVQLPAGEISARVSVERLPLPKGRFYVWVGIVGDDGSEVIGWHPAANFDVVGPLLDVPPVAVARLAPVHVEATWEVEA